MARHAPSVRVPSIYLNAGTSGILSPAVLKAWTRGIERWNQLGQGDFKTIYKQIEETKIIRKALAKFVGASPEELTFTHNSTEGINLILQGFAWKKADILLTSDLEHASELIPARHALASRGVRIHMLKLMGKDPQDYVSIIRKAMGPRVRMLMLSHISYATGALMPLQALAKLCRSKNIFFLVDGAQGFGQCPLNFKRLGLDAYATTGHKWFCGPSGTGFLFVRRQRLSEIQPTRWGWRSVLDDTKFLMGGEILKTSAEKLEESSRDHAALMAWLPQLKFLTKQQRSIETQAKALTKQALYALQKNPDIEILTPTRAGTYAGLLTFRHKKFSAQQLWERFKKHGVICRSIPHLGALRLCFHPSLLE